MSPAIDMLNYAPLVAPGLSGPEYKYTEFQLMLGTTFKRMAEGGTIRTPWGLDVRLDGSVAEDATLDLDDAIRQLDDAGCSMTVLACLKMWSYYYHHKLIVDHPEEVVAEAVAKHPDRFIGAVGYNPLRIEESLRRVEMAVRDWNFRLAYFHPMTFGVAPNDRRCYPLYAKCVELGIPVAFQVGHSAEVLPSDIGRPMLADQVAIEFPKLRINLSHTGWPWTAEFCSMLWRHPNVYGDIAAYFPATLDPQLIEFMNSSRGRGKVLFATNGFDLPRFRREFEELPISDKTKEAVLHRNAERFLDL